MLRGGTVTVEVTRTVETTVEVKVVEVDGGGNNGGFKVLKNPELEDMVAEVVETGTSVDDAVYDVAAVVESVVADGAVRVVLYWRLASRLCMGRGGICRVYAAIPFSRIISSPAPRFPSS